MNQLESRPLRYFVVVAEELNFTRAAERIGIAPPALSRAIAQLEAQLDVRLLERTTRSVSLTSAGIVLLEQARIALNAIDAASRLTRRSAEPSRRLVLTLKADMDGGLLGPAIDAYAREFPQVPLEVILCGFGEQPKMLRDGRADVALLYSPADTAGLEYEELFREPVLIAISARHELAAAESLRPEQLDELLYPTQKPNIWQVPGSGGERPEEPRYSDFGGMLKLIDIGQLAMALPASTCACYQRPQIAYVPTVGLPDARLTVAWAQGSTSLATAAFVRVVSSLGAATELAAQGV